MYSCNAEWRKWLTNFVLLQPRKVLRPFCRPWVTQWLPVVGPWLSNVRSRAALLPWSCGGRMVRWSGTPRTSNRPTRTTSLCWPYRKSWNKMAAATNVSPETLLGLCPLVVPLQYIKVRSSVLQTLCTVYYLCSHNGTIENFEDSLGFLVVL